MVDTKLHIPNKNVFINCPYDDEYKNMMYRIIFLVAKFGCKPYIAAGNSESSDRMTKILSMIKHSFIGIHDISYMEHTPEKPLARFNMPFELGIDFAHKYYCHNGKKRLLILQKKQFLSQKVLSDLSGVDIEAHNGKDEELIKIIRNFFCSIFSLSNVVSSTKLNDEFFLFNGWLRNRLLALGFSQNEYLNEPTLSEFIIYTLEYVNSVGTHY
ncbi:MAG: hypothetical protein WC344_03145 [Bacilli bacterium]|jgi:hypothetical protein